jgi:hypothetical protein
LRELRSSDQHPSGLCGRERRALEFLGFCEQSARPHHAEHLQLGSFLPLRRVVDARMSTAIDDSFTFFYICLPLQHVMDMNSIGVAVCDGRVLAYLYLLLVIFTGSVIFTGFVALGPDIRLMSKVCQRHCGSGHTMRACHDCRLSVLGPRLCNALGAWVTDKAQQYTAPLLNCLWWAQLHNICMFTVIWCNRAHSIGFT